MIDASRQFSFGEDAKNDALSGSWKDNETLREAGQRLKNSDWAAQINYFFGMARASGHYTLGAERRPNPARWQIAANSYYTLVTENPDQFLSKPSVAYDAVLGEGSELNSDILVLRNDGGKIFAVLDALLNDYKNQ